jgi:hypothetical protein
MYLAKQKTKTAKNNIKKLQSTFKKVVIGRAVTALKQQKSKGKGKGEEKAMSIYNANN